ncbi:MAG: AAA domain-containing protein [Clostridia bacterium]|nr:AAA domain-containing protein [Clostridia bacterium]
MQAKTVKQGEAGIKEILATTGKRLEEMTAALGEVIVGQREVIHQVITALLAGGHVLLEGVPGLGKTALVRAIAQVTGLSFRRLQFTPDLMPADISGTMVFREGAGGEGSFQFEPGPIFANLVLADEINRATPKTQSALLEAMQEGTVTTAGVSRPLPRPFFVLATQNPLEMEGTYPLPEAQLDRFLFKILVPMPAADELAAIARLTTGAVTPTAPQVLQPGELEQWQQQVRQVVVVTEVIDYAARLVMATHPGNPDRPEMVGRFVRFGASPRAVQALVLGARAEALRAGRPYADYEDVRRVALPALRHRVLLNYEALAEGVSSDMIVTDILARIPVAREAGV